MPPEREDDGLLFLLLGLAAGAGLLWLWRRRAGGGDGGGPKDRTDALALVESLRKNGTIDDVTAQAAVDMLTTKGVRPFVVMAWLQERISPKTPAGYDPFRFQIPESPSASYDPAILLPPPPQPPPPPPPPPPADSVEPEPSIPFLDFDPAAGASSGGSGGLSPGTIVQVTPDGSVYVGGDLVTDVADSVSAIVGNDGILHTFVPPQPPPEPERIVGGFVVLLADGNLIALPPGPLPRYVEGAYLYQVGPDGINIPLPWPIPEGEAILRIGPEKEIVQVNEDGTVLRAGMGNNRDLCCG